MHRLCLIFAGTLLAFAVFLQFNRPVLAAKGDKAGWSFHTGPGHQALLLWVPLSDGPRVLVFNCPRDTSKFIISSEDVADDQQPGPATLTLANSRSRYDIVGQIARGETTKLPGFTAELAGDPASLQNISAKILPLLEGRGSLKYLIGIGHSRNNMASENVGLIELKGAPAPLAQFKKTCFGR